MLRAHGCAGAAPATAGEGIGTCCNPMPLPQFSGQQWAGGIQAFPREREQRRSGPRPPPSSVRNKSRQPARVIRRPGGGRGPGILRVAHSRKFRKKLAHVRERTCPLPNPPPLCRRGGKKSTRTTADQMLSHLPPAELFRSVIEASKHSSSEFIPDSSGHPPG